MEWVSQAMGLILHLDRHLLEFAANYGAWVYVLLFVIIFCETGLVVTPFLPGDSLLFVGGTVAATGALNIHVLVILLVVAAVLGDSVNYGIGRWLGPRVFRMKESWFFSPRHLHRANAFYEHHGGKTIVIARFVPIIRTYAPFVAGIGAMDYRRFIGFNLVDVIKSGMARVKLAGLARFTADGVSFTDSSEAPFDTVIFATGFAPALAALGARIHTDARGFALRSDRVTSSDQPGLYFVGHNYDSSGGLTNIRRDAPIAAAHIADCRVVAARMRCNREAAVKAAANR